MYPLWLQKEMRGRGEKSRRPSPAEESVTPNLARGSQPRGTALQARSTGTQAPAPPFLPQNPGPTAFWEIPASPSQSQASRGMKLQHYLLGD